MSFLEKVKMPTWLGTTIAIIGIVVGLGFGIGLPGSTTITGKNGAEYKINYNINDAVINLIDKCDLKEVGDSCKVAVEFDTMLVKKGTPTPVQLEVKPDKDVETPDVEVKKETPDVEIKLNLIEKIDVPKIEVSETK